MARADPSSIDLGDAEKRDLLARIQAGKGLPKIGNDTMTLLADHVG